MPALPAPSEMTVASPAMPEQGMARTYFFITALNEADLLPRVLSPFLKLGLTPYRVHASSEHGDGEEISIELRFQDLSPHLADALASRCRAIVGVGVVITALG